MTRFAFVGVIAVVLLVPGAATAQEGKRYALLVGVNEYEHEKLPALKYAVNDAAELGALLEKSGYGVTVLTDETGKKDPKLAPTKANVEKRLKDTLDGAKKGDVVVVALAGHGLQFEGEKDAYFCPSDARPFKDEAKTLVSLGKVYEQLDKSFAGVKVLLVDACRDDPAAGRGSRGVNADFAPKPPSGVASLFSCSAGQRAFEHDDLKHGVFFYHLIEGLSGKAKDADGDVTFGGLATYVQKHVSREVPRLVAGARQSPNLKADLSGESPVLVAAARVAGRRPRGCGRRPPRPMCGRPGRRGRSTSGGRRKRRSISARACSSSACWSRPASSRWGPRRTGSSGRPATTTSAATRY